MKWNRNLLRGGSLALLAISHIACSAGLSTETTRGTESQLKFAGDSQHENRTVLAHLFEWRWTDIAQECETHLGPAGYRGVQVSPPNEHRVIGDHPWWQRYQPVSYRLISRSGNEAEFIDMVERCKAVGVGIYVDAVINHMSAGPWGDVEHGVGSASSRYDKYDYPGLYSRNDFHSCGLTPGNDIRDYGNREQVQRCELVTLSDLKTGTDYVRDTIAGYLNRLLDIGVAGFRLDAAKHMPAEDVRAIVSRLNKPAEIFSEVIDHGSEPISSSEYMSVGRVTEFRYSRGISEKFKSGWISDLLTIGTDWGFVDGRNAVVFTDNHDNQRGHGSGGDTLTHKDPELYALGNAFMLAWPYGMPKVMSSYRFEHGDQGPPSDDRGNTLSANADRGAYCAEGWMCEHRWPTIEAMVKFRNVTHNEDVMHVFSNKIDQIAFARGNKGFLALNRAPEENMRLNHLLQTGLPEGQYCDVISGKRSADRKSCSGATVSVDNQGNAQIDIPGMTALAIHADSRLKN